MAVVKPRPILPDADVARALPAIVSALGKHTYADYMTHGAQKDPARRYLRWCYPPQPAADAVHDYLLREGISHGYRVGHGYRTPGVVNALTLCVRRGPRVRDWYVAAGLVKPPSEASRRATARRNQSRLDALPDPDADDTLGWKILAWDGRYLRSPSVNVIWPEDAVLEAHRPPQPHAGGVYAGIHARRLPRGGWLIADPAKEPELKFYWFPTGIYYGQCRVVALVERFGRAVVGAEGWRAERAVIRAIRAPSTEIGLAIEAAYPTVQVHYSDASPSSRKARGPRSMERTR